MWGEAWAELAAKIFSYVTDEEGLAQFQKRLTIAKLKREIKDAINVKDFERAAARLADLRRLSDAA